MLYLVVRTDVRRLSPRDLGVPRAGDGHVRDERIWPEHRRQTAIADNLEAALHLARALATVGAVRAGRQRVKVIRLEPVPRSRVARPSPYRRAPAASSPAGV